MDGFEEVSLDDRKYFKLVLQVSRSINIGIVNWMIASKKANIRIFSNAILFPFENSINNRNY